MNMKKNLPVIGSLLLSLGLLSGCSQELLEGGGSDGGGNVPAVPAQSGLSISEVGGIATTKSIYTDIDAAEGAHHLQRIGVIVMQNGTYYGSEGFPLQLFHYNGSWVQQNEELVLNDRQGTVYAFSVRPDGAGGDNTFGAKIKGSHPILEAPILSEQTCTYPASDDQPFCLVDQEDYLYGDNPPKVDRETSEAALTMCHFLSRLSFCVMKADGQPAPDANCYVKRVEVTAKDGTGFLAGGPSDNFTFYLDGGTIAGETHSTTIGFVPASNYRKVDAYVADGKDLLPKAFGLAAPVTNMQATVSVTLGAAGNTLYDRTYTSAETTLTWEKGTHYIYLITLTDVSVELSKPVVASWNEVSLDSRPIQPDGVTP